MAKVDFKAPAGPAAQTLKLVAAYCSVQDSISITVADVADVEFSHGGSKAFGLNTACRCMAGMSPLAEQLLGRTPEQQAKVTLLSLLDGGSGSRKQQEALF